MNWKTTISGIGNTLATVLLGLSLIPYSMPPELSTILSPTVKADVLVAALVAKTILGVWNAIEQKDKKS